MGHTNTKFIPVLLGIAGLLGGCGGGDEIVKGEAREGTEASKNTTRDEAGWVRVDMTVESEHPYANSISEGFDIVAPEPAVAVRAHFAQFDLEEGYDFLRVLDHQGGLVGEYTGQKDAFFSNRIWGGAASFVLQTDGSETREGFVIDYFEYLPAEERPAVDDSEGWERRDITIASDNPYAAMSRETFDIEAPADTVEMRIHFDRIDTETDYDFVRVFDFEGNLKAEYSGSATNTTTASIRGNKATVMLFSDGSVQRSGFAIDYYEFKTERGENVHESTHPYISEGITIPTPAGASHVWLHFSQIDLAPGDVLNILDHQGGQYWQITDFAEDVWAGPIWASPDASRPGQVTVSTRLVGADSQGFYGWRVDDVATSDPSAAETFYESDHPYADQLRATIPAPEGMTHVGLDFEYLDLADGDLLTISDFQGGFVGELTSAQNGQDFVYGRIWTGASPGRQGRVSVAIRSLAGGEVNTSANGFRIRGAVSPEN